MIARTQTTSIRVNPASRLMARLLRRALDLCGAKRSRLAARSSRSDFIGRVISRRPILVRSAPGVGGHRRRFEIGPVPGQGIRRPLHERRKTLRGGRIAAIIEIEQVERRREAFDLNSRRLDLRLAQVVQHARADQRHDEADDRDDHEHFDERESALAVPTDRAALEEPTNAVNIQIPPVLHPTTCLTERRAVITETIRPPTTTLMTMIETGPTIPTSRSRLRWR